MGRRTKEYTVNESSTAKSERSSETVVQVESQKHNARRDVEGVRNKMDQFCLIRLRVNTGTKN